MHFKDDIMCHQRRMYANYCCNYHHNEHNQNIDIDIEMQASQHNCKLDKICRLNSKSVVSLHYIVDETLW